MDTTGIISERNILRTIQFIVGFTMIIWSLYFLSPTFASSPGTALSVLAQFDLIENVIGILQLVCGTAVVYGAVRGNRHISVWFRWGLVGCFMFLLTSRLILFGFIPFYWLWQLALVLIAIVLALRGVNE